MPCRTISAGAEAEARVLDGIVASSIRPDANASRNRKNHRPSPSSPEDVTSQRLLPPTREADIARSLHDGLGKSIRSRPVRAALILVLESQALESGPPAQQAGECRTAGLALADRASGRHLGAAATAISKRGEEGQGQRCRGKKLVFKRPRCVLTVGPLSMSLTPALIHFQDNPRQNRGAGASLLEGKYASQSHLLQPRRAPRNDDRKPVGTSILAPVDLQRQSPQQIEIDDPTAELITGGNDLDHASQVLAPGAPGAAQCRRT